MEHVVQIGVNVDDDAIQQAVINQASKQIADKIEKTIFRQNYYGQNAGFSEDAEELLKEAVDRHKDEIISRAAVLIAETLKRSKKYKAILAALDEETE